MGLSSVAPSSLLVALVALVAWGGLAAARQLSRRDLVQELRRQGFAEAQLRNWVCLVEAESSRNTAAVGGPNSDGSHDYGLFQINDRYWCSHGSAGNGCQVRCEDLITDNIDRASACTKKIFSIHGFNAWNGWKSKCQGKPLPDITGF
ncbi:lysozyme-like [Bacillus rossius redtenbacheri]|uniref:lysozyme-like n=1 Tax=Bacillus rossius redtenbacheri TaxID=93214 RepID=UPI002FDD32A2